MHTRTRTLRKLTGLTLLSSELTCAIGVVYSQEIDEHRIRMPSWSSSCSTNWLCDLGYRFALSERVVWDKHPWWVCCLEKVRPRSCLVNASSVSIRRGEEELS